MTILDTKVSTAFVDCSNLDSITLVMLNSLVTMFKAVPCAFLRKVPTDQIHKWAVYATRPFEVLSMDFLKLDHSKHGYQKALVSTLN